MDLSEISRERTLVDLEIARARIVELAARIDDASEKLKRLRLEYEGERLRRGEQVTEKSEAVESRGAASGGSAKAPSGEGFSLSSLFRRKAKEVEHMRWHIDDICGAFPAVVGGRIDEAVEAGQSWAFHISGWLVPLDGFPAFTSVRLSLKGVSGEVVRQAATYMRNDVGAHFGNSAFARSGFRFEIPMSELPPGAYLIDMIGHCPDRGEITAHVGRVSLV